MLVNSNLSVQNYNSPYFKARLGKRQLNEAVNYAYENRCLPELSFCLKQLDKMKGRRADINVSIVEHFAQGDAQPQFTVSHSLVIDREKLSHINIDRFQNTTPSAELYDALAGIASERSLLSSKLCAHNGCKRMHRISPENFLKYIEHNANITKEQILKKFSLKDKPLSHIKVMGFEPSRFGPGNALDLENVHGSLEIVTR